MSAGPTAGWVQGIRTPRTAYNIGGVIRMEHAPFYGSGNRTFFAWIQGTPFYWKGFPFRPLSSSTRLCCCLVLWVVLQWLGKAAENFGLFCLPAAVDNSSSSSTEFTSTRGRRKLTCRLFGYLIHRIQYCQCSGIVFAVKQRISLQTCALTLHRSWYPPPHSIRITHFNEEIISYLRH